MLFLNENCSAKSREARTSHFFARTGGSAPAQREAAAILGLSPATSSTLPRPNSGNTLFFLRDYIFLIRCAIEKKQEAAAGPSPLEIDVPARCWKDAPSYLLPPFSRNSN
jgi:hypothetical protein